MTTLSRADDSLEEGALKKDEAATVTLDDDDLLIVDRSHHAPIVPVPVAIAARTEVLGGGPEHLPSARGIDEVRMQDGRPRFLEGPVLGTGGVGRVVAYEDRLLGRRVAVKTLLPELRGKGAHDELLSREARITGRLEHPNVIPIYDAGVDQSVGPFYAMRVLEHASLHDALKSLRGTDEKTSTWSLGRFLRVFMQVCGAIDHAHRRKVVHCDLKPANVMLGELDEVVVVDWGFAYEMGTESSLRGGTPGYMAPEQLDPRPARIGPRTDVFALGAILYEILSLRRPFPKATMEDMVLRRRRGEPLYDPPRPLRVAARGREVPPELEAVCLRALSLDPEARHESAVALRAEIESFLEGTADRERRNARADELAAQGADLARSYDDLVTSRPGRLAELAALRASIPAWEGPGAKQELWDAEDRETVMESLANRTFQAAVAAYEQALSEVPRHHGSRRGLAKLYWGELLRAQQRRDEHDRIYFEARVNDYDDALFSLGLDAGISVEHRGPGTVVIERHVERGRRLLVDREWPVKPGEGPVRMSFDAGSYVARVDLPGAPSARYPLAVRVGRTSRVEIDGARAARVAPHEVLIAGGVCLLGGHESSIFGRELAEIEVPPFAIARVPVTFGEWLAFVAALEDPETIERHLPRDDAGALYFRPSAEGFTPVRVTHWPGDEAVWRRLPVVGISVASAAEYAAWRSKQDGRAYRLPTEHEWEKAARGTDGRLYPWGDRFDASFCRMRESRRTAAHPEPSGTFEADVSPYGVVDVAGNVAEWALPSRAPRIAQIASRGGAWSDWAADCVLPARRTYSATERSSRVGFRLAGDLE